MLVAKIMAAILFFMMVRWSWPRFRFDQLMSLAWKVMLPLGLLNLAAVAIVSEIMQSAQDVGEAPLSPWIVAGWGWAVLLVGWFCAAHGRPAARRQSARWQAFDAASSTVEERAGQRSESHETQRPGIKWIEEPKLGLAGKMYLPLFLQGLAVTTRHLFSPKVTVSFPEARPTIGNPLIYRGVHA